MTEYRNLGSTGLKVSPLTLGTMMFGAIGNPDHEDSIRIIHRALDPGINLVDTADVYSKGESEVIVGKALRAAGTRWCWPQRSTAASARKRTRRGTRPRTLEDLEGALGADKVSLSKDVLDRIDEIVPPGTTLNQADAGYRPPSLTDPLLRRRSR